MKGTDCTPEQVAHARQFWLDRGWTPGAEKAILTLDDCARMLAWYGALRYVAGRDQVGGELERPGPVDVINHESTL